MSPERDRRLTQTCGISRARRLLLVLPAAAEGAIEADEALVFGALSLSERELGVEERALTIENFEVGGGAAAITHVREPDGFRQIGDGVLLANANLMKLLVVDERIGNVSKSQLDSLAVAEKRLAVLRFGKMQIAFQSAAGEDRLGDLKAVGPNAKLRTHEAGKRRAAAESAAARASQFDLREKLRFGDANFSVGTDEILLGFANIGPALEQSGRHAGGNFGRERLLDEWSTALDAVRVITEENADGVFLFRHLALEIGDGGVGRIENLLGLKDVELGGDAVLDAEFRELYGVFLGGDGVVGDLEFEDELEESKVVAGDVAHEREHNGLASGVRGQELGAGSLRGAANLAEEVELERGVGGEVEEVVSCLEGAFFSAGESGVSRDLRK